MNRFFALIILVTGLTSCTPDSLAPIDYIKWVQDPNNGLLIEKPIGDFKLSLQIEPVEYMALKRQNLDQIDVSQFNKQVSEFGDALFMVLSFETKKENVSVLKHKIVKQGEYQERLEFFSIKAKDHIRLETDTGLIKPAMVHFEHFFELSPKTSMLLIFEGISSNQTEATLVYDDQILGLGPVKFVSNPSQLLHIPTLKIQ